MNGEISGNGGRGEIGMWISNLNVPEFEPRAQLTYKEKRKTSEFVYCRDPFVLHAGKRYYLYQNHGKDGIICSVSEDLENWSDPVYVYETPENFHGTDNFFWAPECHYYNGMFYIFTSVFSSKTNHRNVSVYRADNPLGPFKDIADGAVTPKDWDAIDGTLYIDTDGQPWLVFVHEWTCMPDHNGAMAAAKLSADFTHLISEPIQLFLARELPPATAGVTDGPYLFRSDAGNLFMLWSNFCGDDNYTVAVSKSSNGRLDGEWIHSDKLLYKRGDRPEWIFDGGHSMIVPADDGKFFLSFHSPNHDERSYEHVTLLPLGLSDEGFEIK